MIDELIQLLADWTHAEDEARANPADADAAFGEHAARLALLAYGRNMVRRPK